MENKYLEKIALNRLTKEILKAPSKFNTGELVNKGVLRGEDRYYNAIGNSNKKYLDKLNQGPYKTVVKIGDGMTPENAALAKTNGGAYTHANYEGISIGVVPSPTRLDGYKSKMNSALLNKNQRKMVDDLITRHELHEAKEVTDIAPNVLNDDLNKIGHGFLDRKGDLKGFHFSPRVLGRESNDLTGFYSGKTLDKIPLPGVSKTVEKSFGKAKNQFLKFRSSTSEDEIIKKITGKTYGTDRFSKQDLTKLHNATPDMMMPRFPHDLPLHMPPAIPVSGLTGKIINKVKGYLGSRENPSASVQQAHYILDKNFTTS